MKRPHWKTELYRDKKYLLHRNETCDPEFNAHLRSFVNALPLEAITQYPSMTKAYNALIKLASMLHHETGESITPKLVSGS